MMCSAGHTEGHVLTGLAARYYDIGNTFFGVPLVVRRHVSLIRLRPGDALLDVGCGTGEVIARLHRRRDRTNQFYGIDPSIEILKQAERKLASCSNVKVEPGVGEQLEFADGQLNWVVSCLTLHHLPPDAKRSAVAECYRVLAPSGQLLISDFGPPTDLIGRVLGWIWKRHAYTRDNLSFGFCDFVRDQGFVDLRVAMQAGVMCHLLARKPGG